jgi:hypothetical protein
VSDEIQSSLESVSYVQAVAVHRKIGGIDR